MARAGLLHVPGNESGQGAAARALCVGANGETVAPGQRCVSTSNRNFVGRQGPGARTHLANPSVAAACAIAGRIVEALPERTRA